jgi:hypothetical protein
MKFYTNTHSFRQIEHLEIKELEVGETITICINNSQNAMEFIETKVINPIPKNWKIETVYGFIDRRFWVRFIILSYR